MSSPKLFPLTISVHRLRNSGYKNYSFSLKTFKNKIYINYLNLTPITDPKVLRLVISLISLENLKK